MMNTTRKVMVNLADVMQRIGFTDDHEDFDLMVDGIVAGVLQGIGAEHLAVILWERKRHRDSMPPAIEAVLVDIPDPEPNQSEADK
jgi:hypothetical protein